MLSFLYASRMGCAAPHAGQAANATGYILRIISDGFPLPYNRFGRYCCSAQGLTLLVGEKNAIDKIPCGSLINNVIMKTGKDPKSGALIAELA